MKNENTDGNGGNGASGDLAVIGEGTPNRTQISVQVLQSIYHELTGRLEEVSKSYDEPFQIAHADFEQLHHRITQACEQYQIRASNCSIRIFYLNDTQDKFSSFERFRQLNTGSTSAVESVLLTYNFLILLPKLNQPQSYTVSVRVASRVTIARKMREEMPFEVPKIIRLMNGRVALVSVKYVDYAVARNLLNTVDEWFKTVPKAHTDKVWDYLRKRSHHLPLVARYFVGAVVGWLLFMSLPHFVPPSANPLQLASWLLIGFVGLFAFYKAAYHLASSAEDSLDRWSPLSYVELTAGDKTEIGKARRDNAASLIAGAVKFLGGMLLSLVAKIAVGVAVALAHGP